MSEVCLQWLVPYLACALHTLISYAAIIVEVFENAGWTKGISIVDLYSLK